jgi:hypothetical protein
LTLTATLANDPTTREEEAESMRYRLITFGNGRIQSALYRLSKVKNATVALELLGYKGVKGNLRIDPVLYDVLDGIYREHNMLPPKRSPTRISHA